jgi:plasmid stability protein
VIEVDSWPDPQRECRGDGGLDVLVRAQAAAQQLVHRLGEPRPSLGHDAADLRAASPSSVTVVRTNASWHHTAHASPRVVGAADGRPLVNHLSWRHNGAMTSIQIKDVPAETHAVLRRRAAAAHQSLQEYLRTRLIEEAARPTVDEVLDRAGGRAGGSVPLTAAVQTLRAERDRR